MILGFKKKIKGELTNFAEKILSSTKKHTIREDKHNRWKQGRMIQFVTRGKNFSCEKFAEMPCLGIQKIKIEFGDDCWRIVVDGKLLTRQQAMELAYNDGFDNFSSFLNWFDKDFEGKIIHWTDKRY